MKKRILVSGSGVAGILTAILLDKNKYEVVLTEKGDDFRNIGYSITLWKSGFELLSETLGNSGIMLVEGKDFFPVRGFTIFGGLKLKELKRLHADDSVYILERSHLMELLEQTLLKQIVKEDIRFSTKIKSLEHFGGNASVEFENGDKEAFDLVVVAEGINSTTREIVFPSESESKVILSSQSLQYAWFGQATDLGDWGGLLFTKGHIGVIHPPYSKNLLGFYFTKDAKEGIKSSFEQSVLEIVKQTNGEEAKIELDTSRVFELKEVFCKRYYKQNIILIGDAAHGRPPTLGFGTSLAIEDACALAGTLNTLSSDSFEKDLAMSLERFSSVRSKRVESIYNFQKIVQFFITNSALRVRVLAWFLRHFFGKYMEKKMKEFAAYKIG